MFRKNGRIDGEIDRRVNASQRVVGYMWTIAKMDRVNNEWVLKECSLKENPIGQCERSVLHWFGQIERMSMDRVMKQIYEGKVYGSKGRDFMLDSFIKVLKTSEPRSLNSWYLLHIIETKQNQQGEKAAKYKDGAGDASSSSKNMYSLKSNVMKTHVQEVTQMLPGGLNVLGFFFMGSVDVFEDREFPLNKLLMDFRNELSCKPIMYGGDPSSEILVYFKNSQTGKIPNSYLSPMQDDNEQEGLKTVSAEAELWFKGSVVSQVIIHSDAIVKEAEEAVKSDILRTLSRRLDMHWHSLVEEDINSFEGEKMVHEPPRRVLFPLGDNSITFSDHLFPGEDVEENVDLINSTFNVHLDIADVQEDLEQHDKSIDGRRTTNRVQEKALKNDFSYKMFCATLLIIRNSIKRYKRIVCLSLTSDSPFEVKAGYKENVPDSHFEGYEYHWSKDGHYLEKPHSVISAQDWNPNIPITSKPEQIILTLIS
ncbi:unnamed protein product [Timema podura]|uniref:Uncharacterized protein n=1 Tax=Timema podura TaxID=61482 RepID=A0ABN7NDD4_TIMPD|nr:unnamed protein product [Timema podura]